MDEAEGTIATLQILTMSSVKTEPMVLTAAHAQ